MYCIANGCDREVEIKLFSLCRRHYAHHRTGRLGTVEEKELHGLHKIPEYGIWLHIKDRCNNPKNSSYAGYGGRSIKVCERWQLSFLAFYDDMGSRSDRLYSIDRIDNDGNYSCGKCEQCRLNNWTMNCRWADGTTQRLNQRMRVDNKSGHENISWDKYRQLWSVRIKRKGVYIFGARYNDLTEAIKARDNFLIGYNQQHDKQLVR